jgi:hypothetical protein
MRGCILEIWIAAFRPKKMQRGKDSQFMRRSCQGFLRWWCEGGFVIECNLMRQTHSPKNADVSGKASPRGSELREVPFLVVAVENLELDIIETTTAMKGIRTEVKNHRTDL